MNGLDSSCNSEHELKKRAVEVFLNKELVNSESAKQDYFLKKEFEFSKKNRQIILYLAVAGFIACLAGFVFAASSFIESKMQKTAVNIRDFEDVNLAELINLAKKNEEDLNRARMDLEESQKNRALQIQQAKENFERERKKILAHSIPKSQKKKLLGELKKKEASSLQSIEATYQKEIGDKQQKIASVQEKIAREDQKLQENLKKSEKMFQESLRKNEAVLSETQKVYEIGLSKQKDFYESRIAGLTARYESDALSLKEEIKKMTGFLSSSEKENFSLKEKLAVQNQSFAQLTQKQILLEENFKQLEKDNSDLNKNLGGIQTRNAEIESEKKDLLAKLSVAQKEKDDLKEEIKKLSGNLESLRSGFALKSEIIRKFLNTLDWVAKKRKDHGYILDPSDTKSVLLVINSNYSVKYGDLALVFDENNQYIGALKFLPDSSRYSDLGLLAEAIDLVQGKSFEPFYKIVIKFKTEKKK